MDTATAEATQAEAPSAEVVVRAAARAEMAVGLADVAALAALAAAPPEVQGVP